MTARIRSVDYAHEGTALRGELAWNDEWRAPRPCVVVVHDAMKSDQGFEEERAVTLCGAGFAGFALDVYGADVKGRDADDARRLMAPFAADRHRLQARLRAGLEAAAALPEVDADRMAAVGYCFGGLCALDLARANAPLAGIASFHGLLDAPDAPLCNPPEAPIEPRVLVFHGWHDSFVPPSAILSLGEELTRREADWQLITYGRTGHGFTNMRHAPSEGGDGYQPQSTRRSWLVLLEFLDELFPGVRSAPGPAAPPASGA